MKMDCTKNKKKKENKDFRVYLLFRPFTKSFRKTEKDNQCHFHETLLQTRKIVDRFIMQHAVR